MMNQQYPRGTRRFAAKPLALALAAVLASGGMVSASQLAAAALPTAQVGQLHGAATQHRPLPRRGQARAAMPMATPDRPAGTLVVSSCADDGGSGTLRSVVTSAVSGDTVDLSALTCSTITLAQGAIATGVDNLTLHGPAAGLTIDGGGTDSVIAHYGEGTLSIDHLTIANGYFEGGGGCIFSAANVALGHTTVSGCSTSNAYGVGAGLLVRGNLTLDSSTLSGNFGSLAGGGAYANGVASITNSTISGNSVSVWGGGLYAAGVVTINNSTITANESGLGGGGVFVGYNRPVTLRSTLIAGNTVGDDATYAADLGTGYVMTIAGSNNLITSSDSTLPADTLDSDPRLLPLADHGGSTQTHALAADSPAIDAGNNGENLAFDQRGPGFARVAGPSADIGAFEVQQDDDTIFKDGFD